MTGDKHDERSPWRDRNLEKLAEAKAILAAARSTEPVEDSEQRDNEKENP
jgi:hypothetical protein